MWWCHGCSTSLPVDVPHTRNRTGFAAPFIFMTSSRWERPTDTALRRSIAASGGGATPDSAVLPTFITSGLSIVLPGGCAACSSFQYIRNGPRSCQNRCCHTSTGPLSSSFSSSSPSSTAAFPVPPTSRLRAPSIAGRPLRYLTISLAADGTLSDFRMS